MELFETIRLWHAQGMATREIARRLGVCPKTVRRHLAKIDGGALAPQRATPPSKLQPFRDRIAELTAAGRTAWSIYEELRGDPAFSGCYDTVKRIVRRLRFREPKVYERLEHPPGAEAQIDFTELSRVEHQGRRVAGRRPFARPEQHSECIGRATKAMISPMRSFRITGLDPAQFQHLFGKSDDQLAATGARCYIVDQSPGFPHRLEMRDLKGGETAILLNYTHLESTSPYRSSYAAYVPEGAERARHAIDEIPEVLRSRPLSARVFDSNAMMLTADVADGKALLGWIVGALEDGGAASIDDHSAKRGHFVVRVRRA